MIRPFEFVDPYVKRVLPDEYISPAYVCAFEEAYSSSVCTVGSSTETTTADYLRAAYNYLKTLENPVSTRAGVSMTLNPYSFGPGVPYFDGQVTGLEAGTEGNYEVRVYYCPHLDPATDVLLGSATVASGGAWQVLGPFAGSNDVARLYDTTTGEFVTEAFTPTGLLRTSGTILVTDPLWARKVRTVNTRAQAFAVIAATSIGDYETAQRWAMGLWKLVQNYGTPPEEVSLYTRLCEDDFRRTDTAAWVGYAFAFLYSRYSTDVDSMTIFFAGLLEIASVYLFNLVTTPGDPREGMLTAGTGMYPAPAYNFVSVTLTDAHISDNVAAFYAFRLFRDAFPTHWFAWYADDGVTRVTPTIKTAWDSTLLRPPHVVSDAGVYDLRHNLEDLAWYALAARATGNVSKQLDDLAMLENYRVAGGFTGRVSAYGYPSLADGELSVPGSALAALALFYSGQESMSDTILGGLTRVWADVGFSTHFVNDPAHLERDEHAATAAALSILAGRPNGFLDL